MNDDGLRPLNWQTGNVAISATHFYMIYNDAKEGTLVHWHNKVTGEVSDRAFSSIELAREWIKGTHHAHKEMQYRLAAENHPFVVGQKWLHKTIKNIAIEILVIDGDVIYTQAYSVANPKKNSGMIENDIHELLAFIDKDYKLSEVML